MKVFTEVINQSRNTNQRLVYNQTLFYIHGSCLLLSNNNYAGLKRFCIVLTVFYTNSILATLHWWHVYQYDQRHIFHPKNNNSNNKILVLKTF